MLIELHYNVGLVDFFVSYYDYVILFCVRHAKPNLQLVAATTTSSTTRMQQHHRHHHIDDVDDELARLPACRRGDTAGQPQPPHQHGGTATTPTRQC